MADLLRLEAVTAGYGDAVVLEEVSLALERGGSLALLGRNGAGKTTLVLTIMGFTRVRGGRLRLGDADLGAMPSHRRARAGLGWVPQERWVFPSLTVDEHLTALARPGQWQRDRVFRLFPRLAERRKGDLARHSDLILDLFPDLKRFYRLPGGQLSGGQQQMLAIGRALVSNPSVLLLDEPTEGLAPIMVQELGAAIRGLVGESGLALLLVEQHVRLALRLTDQAVVLDRGRIVHSGGSADLLADTETLGRVLALDQRG